MNSNYMKLFRGLFRGEGGQVHCVRNVGMGMWYIGKRYFMTRTCQKTFQFYGNLGSVFTLNDLESIKFDLVSVVHVGTSCPYN